jgi:glycerol-3-phosphate acyltransferase PlsX
MKIGVDILGGDFAPEATIKGTLLALEEFGNDCTFMLIGNEAEIKTALASHQTPMDRIEIFHAPDGITMSSSPVKSIASSPNSSIVKGFDLLQEGKIDGFCSAGNSGSMLVGAVMKLGLLREDLRPCLLSILPNLAGKKDGILLDVGANADCKPENLLDFAILGSTYAEVHLKIEDPKVGLINIGEEPEKGNQLSIASHKLMKEYEKINFVGNIEGRELFDGKADVAVCSGFVGNVVLKLAEKFYELALRKGLKEDPFFSKMNYERHGGSPVLGVNKPVVVGHGISSPLAIKNMIKLTKELVEENFVTKLKAAIPNA